MSDQVGLRGKAWFQALTGRDAPLAGDPGSVLTADASTGERDRALSLRGAEPGGSLSLCEAREK